MPNLLYFLHAAATSAIDDVMTMYLPSIDMVNIFIFHREIYKL